MGVLPRHRKFVYFQWMRVLTFVLVAAAAATGCGDNSAACGPNTKVDNQGYCVPDDCGPGTAPDPNTGLCVPDGSMICTNGTKLDPGSGKCVVDPNACQDGTVLIDGRCVDPTRGLTADLDEGPEPNGMGILEASANPAGTIALKPVGGPGFILHGQIAPFQDLNGDGQMDPDVDTYELVTAGPVLVHVTADGVAGIAAGFQAVTSGASGPLATWTRFGMNVTGDTSQRQLYLPAAGTYLIAIADTRTLFRAAVGGPVDAAPGPGDYYVTIDQLADPMPAMLTVTAGIATQTGTMAPDADVQFFTAMMGATSNQLTLAMPATQAVASLVVANPAGTVLKIANESSSSASMTLSGFPTTDRPIIAVDTVYNTAIDPAAYTLTLHTN